jgi:hypothetical protein
VDDITASVQRILQRPGLHAVTSPLTPGAFAYVEVDEHGGAYQLDRAGNREFPVLPDMWTMGCHDYRPSPDEVFDWAIERGMPLDHSKTN